MRQLFNVSFVKKALSYCFPLKIHTLSTKDNESLTILLYRNQWILATEDALYSDGLRYAPFRLAFNKIPLPFLQNIKTCLLLGGGLGSAIQILDKNYNKNIDFTIVEINEQILQYCLSLLSSKNIKNINPFCADAIIFVHNTTCQYDLICVDVFIGREVPIRFQHKEFVQQCHTLLNKNGKIIFNYIIQEHSNWTKFKSNIEAHFDKVYIIKKGINRILICSKNKE